MILGYGKTFKSTTINGIEKRYNRAWYCQNLNIKSDLQDFGGLDGSNSRNYRRKNIIITKFT
jgi:hypothetical protein